MSLNIMKYYANVANYINVVGLTTPSVTYHSIPFQSMTMASFHLL